MIECKRIDEDDSYKTEARILIYSPIYNKENDMRYRIINSGLIKYMTDATHWARLTQPKNNKGDN